MSFAPYPNAGDCNKRKNVNVCLEGCSLLKCAVATVGLAIAGLASGTVCLAQELTNVRITVDYRLYGANAPMWCAQASGLFRQAGINAIVDGSSGSGEAITRVASGAYDVAYADIGTFGRVLDA